MKIKRLGSRILAGVCVAALSGSVWAQSPERVVSLGTPNNPKVTVSWNRYYDYDEVYDLCRKIAAAHPHLVRVGSIGQSLEKREIPVLTISDFAVGKEEEKPAYYIDGNIHSNEIQASEVALYTAWFLTEQYDKLPFITELLKDKVFYIVPTINPDARNNFLYKPNTPHSPRSGMMSRDDDRDGRYEEDGFDDLDGDGNITEMRRKNPRGRLREDPQFPGLLVPVAEDEVGTYELLGNEGIDNDGDGRVNEDPVGYYDPNRDWAWWWQPEYIQRGAGAYPSFQPETRAVVDFFMAHPNIAGAMSYHNTGGMFLRGPGSKEDVANYLPEDVQVYNALGKKGERMTPGYRYITTFEDLYQTYGAETDWMHGARGVVAFTGELYTDVFMYRQKSQGYFGDDKELYKFNKELLLGDGIVPWKKYNHPQYGEIEIGGYKKLYTRINPGFLLEEDAHRNTAFTLYHASQTPKLEFAETTVKPLGEDVFEVTAVVANRRLIPTRLRHEIKNKIDLPDFVSLEGASVLAAYQVTDKDLNLTKIPEYSLGDRVAFDSVPGNDEIIARFVVKGRGPYRLSVISRKGGTVRTEVRP